jgi:hypothetical protein
MNWSLFQCVITLMFVCLAVRIMNLSSQPKRLVAKVLTVLALVSVFFLAGISVDRGWPSREALPTEFVFIHAVVQKPAKQNAGYIVVLIRVKEHPDLPHSVVLPYTEELGITLELASMQTILEGEIPVTIESDGSLIFHIKAAPSEQPAKGFDSSPKPFTRST